MARSAASAIAGVTGPGSPGSGSAGRPNRWNAACGLMSSTSPISCQEWPLARAFSTASRSAEPGQHPGLLSQHRRAQARGGGLQGELPGPVGQPPRHRREIARSGVHGRKA